MTAAASVDEPAALDCARSRAPWGPRSFRPSAFSTTGGRALAPTPPEPGRWYHLVGVRDAASGQFRLYVDGQLAGSLAQSCAEPATGHTVLCRAQFGGNQVDFWRGAVDQVHVYDRALSDAEVRDLYQSGR